MRKYPSIKDPYEKLKEFTRGKDISHADYQNFILSIHGLPQDEIDKLLYLKPSNYTGYAQYLAKNIKKF
jgi:adenylosuccinate lyase